MQHNNALIDVAQLQRGLEAINRSLEPIEGWTQTFESIEESLWPDQCTLVIQALRSFQSEVKPLINALQGLEVTSPFASLQITIGYLHAKADELVLLLVVYRPHARLVTEVRLRQRQRIAGELRRLISITTHLNVPSGTSSIEAVQKRSHLHLIEGEKDE